MLSKKTQYGLKALGYLASKYGEGPILISEIAKKKKIPVKFLESILLQLKNGEWASLFSGIEKSIRGYFDCMKHAFQLTIIPAAFGILFIKSKNKLPSIDFLYL